VSLPISEEFDCFGVPCETSFVVRCSGPFRSVPLREVVRPLWAHGSDHPLYPRSVRAGKLASSAYYRGAVKALRDNQRACNLLGEPLRFQTVKLGDTENRVTTEHAHVRMWEGCLLPCRIGMETCTVDLLS